MADLWNENRIQFPRLLAEISAMGLTFDQYVVLCESMDLSSEEIDELLERAEIEWQRHKAEWLELTKEE